jgi:arylsulfatase A-like enzyme
MIIRWPERLNSSWSRGQFRNELVELRDVLPTFLDAVGMMKPDEMDGGSMLDILRDKPWRNILDLEHSRIYEPDNAWVSLTDGTYKYIYFTLTGQQQLFDLERDPKETIDLTIADGYEELVQDWRKKMIQHLSIRGAPWVVNGDLAIQKESQKFSPNDARFTENP